MNSNSFSLWKNIKIYIYIYNKLRKLVIWNLGSQNKIPPLHLHLSVCMHTSRFLVSDLHPHQSLSSCMKIAWPTTLQVGLKWLSFFPDFYSTNFEFPAKISAAAHHRSLPSPPLTVTPDSLMHVQLPASSSPRPQLYRLTLPRTVASRFLLQFLIGWWNIDISIAWRDDKLSGNCLIDSHKKERERESKFW